MRQNLLDDAAKRAGGLWAASRRDELSREGRPVEGGWPGTIAEARARAADAIRTLLHERAMVALTYAELGRAAQVTYGEARRTWLGMLGTGPRMAASDDD
jgi:hypothetical protein